MLSIIKKTALKPLSYFYMTKFDRSLGRVVFSNNNFLSYNLFNNFLYKSQTSDSTFLKNYDKYGFVKGPSINKNLIIAINEELKTQNSINNGSNKFEYELTNKIKLNIREICNNDLNLYLNNFKKYYRSDIFVTNVAIWKNFSFKKIDGSSDHFSESYHNDAYLKTYFKIFINIEDVGEENGPLHIIPRDLSKKFSKIVKFKGRGMYEGESIEKMVYKNIGKKNESTFFNSSMCIHRAGIPMPNKTRSMLAIVFNAIPNIENNNIFYFENKGKDIWSKKDILSKKYSKPVNIYDFISRSKII